MDEKFRYLDELPCHHELTKHFLKTCLVRQNECLMDMAQGQQNMSHREKASSKEIEVHLGMDEHISETPWTNAPAL